MTQSMAIAWARDNVQVNALLPGWTETDMGAQAVSDLTGRMDLNERIISRTPMGRWGKPEELQGAAIFLASAASNWVTGSTLVADGGYTA